MSDDSEALLKNEVDFTVYIGSYTHFLRSDFGGKGKGIYCARLDGITGKLMLLNTTSCVNPSYLALSQDLNYIYTCSELAAEDKPVLSAFRINQDRSLSKVNEQLIPGSYPCHIAAVQSNVFVACYGTGNVVHFPLDEQKTIQPYLQNHTHSGISGLSHRQKSPHAHQVVPCPRQNEIYVCDLGIDTIKAYTLDGYKFAPSPENDIPVTKAGGVRHLVFDNTGVRAYAINELTGHVSILKREQNRFKEISTVTSLPNNFNSIPSSSAIRLHPNQKYLYVANRQLEAITIFEIQSDKLKRIGIHYTDGSELRDFNISPDGKWLIASHQNSDDTVIYLISSKGNLFEKYRTTDFKSPVCVVFASP